MNPVDNGDSSCPGQTGSFDGPISSSDPGKIPTDRSAAVIKTALPVRHFASKFALLLPPDSTSAEPAAASVSKFRHAATAAVPQASASSSLTADARPRDAASASWDTKEAVAAAAGTGRRAAGSPSCLTLMQVMQQGTYGAFARAVAPLFGEHLLAMPDLKLPCIVIMGNLGCGKTALAQRITGCRAFSNVAQACTASRSSEQLIHQPVSVTFWQTHHHCMSNGVSAADSSPTSLPHAEECHEETWTCCESGRHNVAGLDKSGVSIDGTHCRDSRDEIRLTCTCPLHFSNEPLAQVWSCPLEVIDPPGIRAYPAAAHRFSSTMYRAYSHATDTILLCVAEASFSDLRSAQALAIAAEDAPSRTIICLTKADLISSQEVKAKVIDRLQGSAADMQDFSRQPCFAMACHDSIGPVNAGTAGSCSSCCIPMAADEHLSPQVTSKLGVDSLLRHIARLCHVHIRRNWLPQVRAQLLPQIRTCQGDLQELGPAPCDLNHLGLIRSLQAHVKFQTLMKFFWTAPEIAVCVKSQDLLDTFQDLPPAAIHRLVRKDKIPLRSLGAQLLADHMATPPSLQFYTQLQAVVQHVKDAISDWLDNAEYKQGILHCYLAALREAEHLQRLQGFKQAVSIGIDRAIDIDSVKESVMAMISPAISSLHASAKPSASKLGFKLSKLDQLLRAAIIAEVVMPLKEDPAELASCLLPGFKIVEKRAAAEERAQLQNRLRVLQHAQKELDAIQTNA